MHNPEEKILAIDFGTVRIGLAISRYILAEPLDIIPNDDKMFSKIQTICSENEVKKIIIGMSENEMALKTKDFAFKLENEINKSWDYKPSIEFMDETLSSYYVHQKLKNSKKSKRTADIDHLAAAEFLQNWLDEN
ncbi:Holliday junction resolvase RuvX [Candidatus Woesebacteria bacterium]|nr:Holliday junction resolvase RuvX [Candidatus Woesebacteria bacterium]